MLFLIVTHLFILYLFVFRVLSTQVADRLFQPVDLLFVFVEQPALRLHVLGRTGEQHIDQEVALAFQVVQTAVQPFALFLDFVEFVL